MASVTISTGAGTTVTEGNHAIARYTLSSALTTATVVNVSLTGWGASATGDYSGDLEVSMGTSGVWVGVSGGQITLSAGVTEFSLRTYVNPDSLIEVSEAVVFVVSQNASTVGIANSWWVQNIVNIADPAAAAPGAPIVPVSISVGTPSPTSATEGTAAMSTFHLSGALGVATSISASVTGWGATAGVDYSVLYYRPGSAAYSGGPGSGWIEVGPDGLIALAAGTTDFQLGVDVYNDTLTESFESVVFVVNQNAATVGITNSWYVSSQVNLADPASAAPVAPIVPVSISVGTPSPTSATEGTAAMSTFHLSGALGVATSVSASVTGWGATAGVDYSVLYYRPGNSAYGSGPGWIQVGPDGLIALAAGTTDFQLGVDVYADTVTESFESVVFVVNQNASTVGITNSWYVSSQVNLTDPAAAAPGAPIVPVSISVGTPSPTSATEGSAAMSTFHLSGALGVATSISASVTGWGATAGVDYSVLYYRPGSAAYSGGPGSGWIEVGPDGLIALAAGTTDFQLGVDVFNDTLTESFESVVFVVNQNASTVGITNSWYVSSQVNLADPVPVINAATPLITSGAAASFAENGTGTVYAVTATDADAATTLTYALGGTDALRFNIDASTGAVTFKTAPNYEDPTDSGADNIYNITVTASDGTNTSAPQAVAITVTNRDEVAPTITTGAAASAIVENSGAGQVIYTAASTDSGDTASGVTTYSLKPSVGDAIAFSINAASGAVTLTANPDFETKPSYSFTVVATDAAGNASEKAVNLAVTDVVESLAGQSVIDLGSYGKLIAPVQVEGKWYYFWDRSGDGTSANTGSLNGSVDYTTHNVLDGIFQYDSSGVLNTAAGTNTSDTYRYANLNGVHLALPTANGGIAYPQGINTYQNGTAYTDAGATTNGTTSSFNELLAIWDAYNGTGTGLYYNGTPSGWQASHYWSATSSASGHASVSLNLGFVYDNFDNFDSGDNNYYVALQVL